MTDELDSIARKWALWNATKFKGKANPNAVLGKILQEMPEIKKDIGRAMTIIDKVVEAVNKMPLNKQEAEFSSYSKENISSVVGIRKEHGLFDGIVDEGESVITAFPPEPSKYPHIGHAKAILLNYELAKQHGGKFILRFEDTNPKLAKKEFYDIHLDNYRWLGIEPDEIQYASDFMDKFYELARKLVDDKQAYVCSCDQETIKKHRFKGESCEHVDKDGTFDDLLKAQEGSMILRLKGDMAHKNSAMRDPTLMRIIELPHPRTKDKYRVWPTYDFENAAMDGLTGITHRLRSKEFEMRNEVQRFLQKLLGFKETRIREFARFNLEGVESSGRIIREGIENKELIGWDDPSLTTLVALRRRGFMPQAIKDFVLSTGITKSEALFTWNDLEVYNRRILDEKAERYFFIDNPVAIEVEGCPPKEVELKKHPTADLGKRKLVVNGKFFLAKSDLEHMTDGKLYRLMDCCNIEKRGNSFAFVSEGVDEYRKAGESIFHWLPQDSELIPVEVLMPDKSVKKGMAESGIRDLKEGTVIQFERFGFVRLDSIESPHSFWYTHK